MVDIEVDAVGRDGELEGDSRVRFSHDGAAVSAYKFREKICV